MHTALLKQSEHGLPNNWNMPGRDENNEDVKKNDKD